ncbi:MAG: PLP-dependent transferase [Deltaproteobacteria bacterium]
MKGFTTKAIHGIGPRKDPHGSLRVPVYDSVAFEHENAESLQSSFAGRKPAHVYSRITNPTVEDFEQKILLLSDGRAALAVSSGMAAISSTLQRAIDSATCAVFLETVTNPQLEVADIATISQITREQAVPLVVDNTLTTPYLFNSRDAGVDIELLSSTKYISGGATSVGGVIIDNGTFDWRQSEKLAGKARSYGAMAFIGSLRQEIYRNVGACLSPHNAYLQSLGLETMGLRIEKSCRNAMAVATFLQQHPKVRAVHYPGLEDSPFHETATAQFGRRYGGLLTFDLQSKKDCFSLMNNLEIIRRATNVNDNKTLILHPASTIFAEYPEEEKVTMGIRPTTLRLSVGIEDQDDLLDDLQRGLELL